MGNPVMQLSIWSADLEVGIVTVNFLEAEPDRIRRSEGWKRLFADLLSLQKKTGEGGTEENNGTALHKAAQLGNAVMLKGLLDGKSIWVDEEDGRGELISFFSL